MKLSFHIRFHTRYGESLSVYVKYLQQIFPLQYVNFDFWSVTIDLPNDHLPPYLDYYYSFKNISGQTISDNTVQRHIPLPKKMTEIVIVDYWNSANAVENVFYTAPFKNILLRHADNLKSVNRKKVTNPTHIFSVKAPLVKKNEVVCIAGNQPALGDWNTNQVVLMEKIGDHWSASLSMPDVQIPLHYKYGIYNKIKKTFTHYENGENRTNYEQSSKEKCTLLNDGFIRLPNNSWKGAGVAIPVSAMRSEKSWGIGEFNDLKLLADWAGQASLQLIQLLPVNDTTATFTNTDSYPYAAISAFALHPIYLNPDTMLATHGLSSLLIRTERKLGKKLNALKVLAYEEVLKLKWGVFKKIYEAISDTFFETDSYQGFYKKNQDWLGPYAVFCYMRDSNGSANYYTWKSHRQFIRKEIEQLCAPGSAYYHSIRFYYFVQYHLYLQLSDAVKYIHEKGIVLKGDIPIGVYRYGCDTWMSPELYHLDMQAGAPPDNFAQTGQNWGFPTYNWERMRQDGFAWWKRRFEQMNLYFDAFRIDHILGFFRIWSIPENAVQGIMGYFVPAKGLTEKDFAEYQIETSIHRLRKPFINEIVLQQIFGNKSEAVKKQFLSTEDDFNYTLLPEFNTQRKIERWFAKNIQWSGDIQQGLYILVSNVLLLTLNHSSHFRFDIQKTISYQALPYEQQQKLLNLYNHYFFHRQNELWKKEGLGKLTALKSATNMLVCGEDLGLVPDCVPDVMQQLGILSLEIQRMPKKNGEKFLRLDEVPYLSVVMPSTHDMSTIRAWWEENKTSTQDFYTNILHLPGEAPADCMPWINRTIVLQHLRSPAMWSIFLLQDLLGMDGKLRRENPLDERINNPADPRHYWSYRMHITLEQLCKKSSFNKQLKADIKGSGR